MIPVLNWHVSRLDGGVSGLNNHIIIMAGLRALGAKLACNFAVWKGSRPKWADIRAGLRGPRAKLASNKAECRAFWPKWAYIRAG